MPRLKTLPGRTQRFPDRVKTIEGGSWRAGKTTTQRGYGYRWQQYRLRFLAEHPLCERCQALGIVTAATVVDHREPHQGDERLFWDPKNHEPMCKPHHDGEKQREEAEVRKGC